MGLPLALLKFFFFPDFSSNFFSWPFFFLFESRINIYIYIYIFFF